MLDLRLVQGSPFKNVLEATSDLFSEATFDFSCSTGFEIQALDARDDAFVVLLFGKEAFDYYRLDSDLSIGLDLAALVEVIRCVNDDDSITIKMEEGWSNICFSFESPEDDEISEFHFDVTDNDVVVRKISEYPESEYQAVVSMPAVKFMDICKKLSSVVDCKDAEPELVIKVREDCALFYTGGEDVSSSSFLCKQTQNFNKAKEPIRIIGKETLRFNLRYINSFSKVSTLSDQVTIRLSLERPAVFEYKIAQMGCIKYYVLPLGGVDKMQNEGDEVQSIAKEDEMQN